MDRGLIGMIAGMALAFAAYFGGFGAFLLVAALGALGYGAGSWLDGGDRAHELRALFERNRR
ncbi:hypothetical protein [Streptomyces qinglanensis]|uniref:Small integral membrane protein n=1 Tax=Streptomyces qinglanensis TaxID=943816 RepID=A0A1H9PLW0_9ACTN|nr:hypothetical protein [Streptomyces qinglanensis]SER48563.1 hypothetical protein SAMN05421870_10277 [Streptomyces qinglanensis]